MKESLAVRPQTVESRAGNEVKKPPTHCLFIPGMQATTEAMFADFGIYNNLVEQYGKGNVTITNSAISSDTPNSNRYKELADIIMTRARQGPLDIVMHSLGATEFLFAKKIIRKRDRKFFRDPIVMANINFTKIGESGSSIGLRERIRYVREVFKLSKEKAIKAHYAIPSKRVSSKDITTIYSEDSNIRPEFTTVPLENPDMHDNFQTPEETAVREAHDMKLQKAIAKKDYVLAKEVSQQRGEDLNPVVQTIFEGTPDKKITKKRIRLGGFKGLRLLFRAIGNKPMRELKKLYRMGYQVNSLVPEFDRIVTLARSSRFYQNMKDAIKHIRIMVGAPHDGPALQADVWAKAIKEVRIRREDLIQAA